MPVITNVRANCASISRPKSLIAGGNDNTLNMMMYTVKTVMSTRKIARERATVVEPGSDSLLCIDSAPTSWRAVRRGGAATVILRARVLPLDNVTQTVRAARNL